MQTAYPVQTGDCLMADPGRGRFVGVDVGTETIKLIELQAGESTLHVTRRAIVEHGKEPGPALVEALRSWNWDSVTGAAVCGRFASQLQLPRVPVKQAQLRGYRYLFGDQPATLVNIGSHGFSILEIRPHEPHTFRENSRCSQGTGNFLRQLTERFSLSVKEAAALCADIRDPAPVSARCPVILKTDITHLANQGEDRARILAGLFDAVCENVLVLLKPGVSPARVLLTGGVSRSPRVRRVLGEWLARQGMSLMVADDETALCLEALGSALIAAESPNPPPPLSELLRPPRPLALDPLPPLADALPQVRRMPAFPLPELNGDPHRLIIGLDIGSTGSKAVALEVNPPRLVWEGYRQTLGDPVGAAQDLLRQFTTRYPTASQVLGFGATGSGRHLAGSLLAACYGPQAVLILNELVAHATGALHYDPHVDTIFEIGGQDAKYIRLNEGRIIDCAMNEACSAGTGSFIEEQGRRFAAIANVQELGNAALAAPTGVSLGQHCSVFMAEMIDEAVAAGVPAPAIISGLYDSVVQNYLNRVKGNRSVGQVIFCQGMPFAADALAAAVARHTGRQVIVPPNPGTVGAMGIALLAARELDTSRLAPVDLARFLTAKVERKDTFICHSSRGCGGAGNRCRIERLRTRVNGLCSSFSWGGGCALHDQGIRRRKLPDLAPDPFREREETLRQLIAPLAVPRGKPRIALCDEFMLKGLFPFFAAFLHQAGFALEVVTDAGQAVLKLGIQAATVPFCAPMQLFHGLAERLAATGADWIFVPMLRSVPRAPTQRCSTVCPIVQACPDLTRWTLNGRLASPSLLGSQVSHLDRDPLRMSTGPHCPGPAPSPHALPPRMLAPIIDFGEGNLDSQPFLDSCQRLGSQLGLTGETWRVAWQAGAALQRAFDASCLHIGEQALAFCHRRNLVPVVVLGRTYTIYNPVLNSNVPAILREQGVIGIPADCYPLSPDVPLFNDLYWGYGQNLLRAAHQVRRAPGVYALYCSNYSCGPDSFNLHFAAYTMAGKPFAVIETDGHCGDAGTRTRIEAFLHCVDEDRRATHRETVLHDFARMQFTGLNMADALVSRRRGERLLVPYLGPASEAVAAGFRGLGWNAEALPPPDLEALRRGRLYTSGKECLPMPLTLGTLLQRLDRATPDERFLYLFPSANGPCRFGVYNLLNQIVLDRLGWRSRVRIWSPNDNRYFEGMSPGVQTLMLAGMMAADLLKQALLDTRPGERKPGTASATYARFHQELLGRLETAARGDLSLAASLWQVATGRLFGLGDLLHRAGREFAACRGAQDRPVVELTGEIYVRSVDFSNDFIIERLEERGLRVRLSPITEWLNYCAFLNRQSHGNRLRDRFGALLRSRIETAAFTAITRSSSEPHPPAVHHVLEAARPYLSDALEGEAVLTLGTPLHQWFQQRIDGVVNVGPLECMPTKIAEAQFQHVARHEGLPSLTLPFNGEPLNTAALDNFAFEVKAAVRPRSIPRPARTHL